MRKKATASMLNQRVSQVPGRAKLVIFMFWLPSLVIQQDRLSSGVKFLTYSTLSNGVAEFDSKLESNGSTGA